MRGTLVKEGTIDPGDVDELFVTDSPEDAAAHVRQIGLRDFGPTYGPRMKRRWFLGEEGGRIAHGRIEPWHTRK